MRTFNTQPVVDRYLGQKYGDGTQGCLEFAKAFYSEIFGVLIMADYLKMLQFFKVVKTPKFGDIVLIKNHPVVVNHLGIYLGENEFLHGGALKGGDEVILSRTTDAPWNERIVGYLRHPKNYDNN